MHHPQVRLYSTDLNRLMIRKCKPLHARRRRRRRRCIATAAVAAATAAAV
eukprot:CAMPEP_0119481326 /NCGR_PEP_ID=MMETSP1344-20130328/9725_1 /TAXON_ID=236787 /ORGANISM="Florenciella parvula, Strain CCMP2471" /LENGTH=49 /DNA_ID= /DNA_START= /DNA_END= /DNA_ORIENTATION=